MLCDSSNYIVEPSVHIEKTSEYNEMPMKNHQTGTPGSNINESSPYLSSRHFNSFTSTSLPNDRNKIVSKHPNIHHHPTIHPHKRYQRNIINNCISTGTNCINTVQMTENNRANNPSINDIETNEDDDEDINDKIIDNDQVKYSFCSRYFTIFTLNPQIFHILIMMENLNLVQIFHHKF